MEFGIPEPKPVLICIKCKSVFIVSYELMTHMQIPSKKGGAPEKKEVLLEDHDPIWVELRHAHIAYVSMKFEVQLSFMSIP